MNRFDQLGSSNDVVHLITFNLTTPRKMINQNNQIQSFRQSNKIALVNSASDGEDRQTRYVAINNDGNQILIHK